MCRLPVHGGDFTAPSYLMVNFASKKDMLLFSSSSPVNTKLPVGYAVFVCCVVYLPFLCGPGMLHSQRISPGFSVGNPLVLWL